jgi:hypothetical protein
MHPPPHMTHMYPPPHMTRILTILSHLDMRDSMTPILEETLEPPTMAAKGRFGTSTCSHVCVRGCTCVCVCQHIYWRICMYYIKYRAAEVVELLLQQEARNRGREELRHTGGGRVRAVRCGGGGCGHTCKKRGFCFFVGSNFRHHERELAHDEEKYKDISIMPIDIIGIYMILAYMPHTYLCLCHIHIYVYATYISMFMASPERSSRGQGMQWNERRGTQEGGSEGQE